MLTQIRHPSRHKIGQEQGVYQCWFSVLATKRGVRERKVERGAGDDVGPYAVRGIVK